MALFRLFLAACLVAIVAYTSVTIANHGWNLLPVFFGDLLEMGWPGQFNLDFMTFLALSAIWVAWRHQFSTAGLGLAVLAFFGGMLFLSVYLLIHLQRSRGDMKVVLLGEGRAA
ncbi:MAG: hypothetical protein O9296_09085 [Novosphingobium sp.]|jgi:hypothetical protein|nr:hypothetical protein [Novosphingobium sp.]